MTNVIEIGLMVLEKKMKKFTGRRKGRRTTRDQRIFQLRLAKT